jgi:hypothetical protein
MQRNDSRSFDPALASGGSRFRILILYQRGSWRDVGRDIICKLCPICRIADGPDLER